MYKMLVRRGDHEQFERLYQAFSETIPVVWERRKGERRRQSVATTEERRQGDRRGPPPASWSALGFVVVRTARFS
jgi:hypothetical protein